ncbi:MAG TPA: hypothetical protein P5572_03845 [Phycisphaerae bacterium]|nr:hypothetical protein [Phycisphaerae bacterium]
MKVGKSLLSAFGLARVLTVCAVVAATQVALGYDPLAGDYSKENPLDIRLMAYNHQQNFISDPSTDAEFNRILTAINPDMISFEEFVDSVSANAIASRLNSILPIDGGGSWQVHLGMLGGIRTVLASRYPLTMKRIDTIPASSTRGVTMALVDLPDAVYPVDVYLMGVHLKCCGNPGGSEDASRQDSADAIANWMGDARGVARPSGNNIALPAGTPMFVLGDFNLVGGPQPGDTIVTGDIQDNSTYGPDVKGDWDNSNITDLLPADPFTGSLVTWQGSGSYPPSTLDHMFYTDDAVTIAHSFVFNTATMSAAARAALGVQAGDTLEANSSDHLPIVADLRLVTCTIDADCDDGNPCNGAETCTANGCAPGAPLVCDDSNPCTDDTCVAGTGCTFTDNSAPCNDGNPCTTNDTCALGACGGTPLDCSDGVYCNGVETCNAQSGCVSGAAPCGAEDWCDETNSACVPLGNGDFDGDQDVDLVDFGAFQRCYGQPAGVACEPANIVGADAEVNAADLAAFIALLDGV